MSQKTPLNIRSTNTAGAVGKATKASMPLKAKEPKVKINNFKAMQALLKARRRPNAREFALYQRMISGKSK